MMLTNPELEFAPNSTTRERMLLCAPFVFLEDVSPCAFNDDGHTRFKCTIEKHAGIEVLPWIANRDFVKRLSELCSIGMSQRQTQTRRLSKAVSIAITEYSFGIPTAPALTG